MRPRHLPLALAVAASAAIPLVAPSAAASVHSTAAAAVASSGSVAYQTSGEPLQRDQLLYVLNAERDRAGLAPLALNGGVANVARDWSAHLARQGHLEHRPDLAAALAREGVTGWSSAGENVGYGTHVFDVHREFMASPGHRSQILSSSYSAVGIGVTEGGGRVWVTVDFVG